MIHRSNVLVITGSVRPQRIGLDVAKWVAEIGRAVLARDLEVIDLKDWTLPMDAEPGIPAVHGYVTEDTKAWSAKIASAEAVVFLTPQYNWGYPAALKNAIDHLYKEWLGKPGMIVTYGSHGGGKCAARLRQVLEGLEMKLAATMPGLQLSRESIKANTGSIDPARTFTEHRAELERGFQELGAILRA